MEFTKAERRQLRELAGSVYEAEAHQMLEELESEFKRWREGEILSSELLSAIHEFHQHESRELWSMYHAVADGYFLFLKPLGPGEHTLNLIMTNPDQSKTGVNYTLIVARRR